MIPWYVTTFVWMVLAAALIVFVVWPIFGKLDKAQDRRKKRWEKMLKKKHPELFTEM